MMVDDNVRTLTVELRSLDQQIKSPVIQGAGDVNGRVFRVVFTHKAACQLSKGTRVYLNWMHQELRVRGYNSFTQVPGHPEAWEIHWPAKMLHEGTVICRIELVDDVSVSPSNNFVVRVLQNPNDGSSFIVSDDFSEFQQAIIDMETVSKSVKETLDEQRRRFDDFESKMDGLVEKADEKISDLTDIDDKIAGKADKADTYTKVETVDVIREEISNAGHVTRVVCDELPHLDEAEQNVIYVVVKRNDAGEGQKYDEWMLIDGAYEKIGDSQPSLDDYPTRTEVAETIREKVGDIDDGTTLKQYVDAKVTHQGEEYDEAIRKAVKESKEYAESLLQITDF